MPPCTFFHVMMFNSMYISSFSIAQKCIFEFLRHCGNHPKREAEGTWPVQWATSALQEWLNRKGRIYKQSKYPQISL